MRQIIGICTILILVCSISFCEPKTEVTEVTEVKKNSAIIREEADRNKEKPNIYNDNQLYDY